MSNTPLLKIKNLVKHFDISGGLLDQLGFVDGKLARKKTIVHAVNNVSFEIQKGETLSVVGESGCGKSTLARTVIGLYEPTGGEVHYRGERVDNKSGADRQKFRTNAQMIFQDPYASLNPRMKVSQILEEPVRFHCPELSDAQVKERVAGVMKQVGINPVWGERYPHEFSGGQRQRISIARALVLEPEFIVADEPISALDVSIQAQVLNLMMDLQRDRNLTYLFISHDLSVVEHISNRVAVMYLGSLCELADAKELFANPRHPYTKALLSAIPRMGKKGFSHIKLQGDVPTPINLPSGCVFHGRCRHANQRCVNEIPQPITLKSGTICACHGVEEGRL